uniref:Beta-ketoacyl-[acyl-carrier-protein] synthase III n=1 Tax=Helminthocladia australis TaxID=260093 RepID=A0A1G4NTD8_9FLOR|nr:Beta-ketoacyl-acyl carrier protein synthase III [Helminthocladia australis]SCW21885.1 Beta-ketoacyl-acyl carrier protein synthase III [Helminthocladia australis]
MAIFNTYGSHLLSTGSSVPDLLINNDTISNFIDTSDQWISTRTGIRERRLITSNQSIIDLAANASNEALEKASLQPEDLDLILLATSTQNDLFGSASQLQASLKAINAAAFDITAACSGFVMGLVTAHQFIQTGAYKNVLIVGADTLSQWVDWSDRTTCILFGDGAGAAILQRNKNNDILGFQLNTNGNNSHHLSIGYSYSETIKNSQALETPIPRYGKIGHYAYLTMNGKEVYKFAVSAVPRSINKCLEEAKLSTKDITWLLLHQANQRIMETVANKLNLPMEKVLSNIQLYGNTSAASIPLALNEAFKTGHICNGDIIVISGFGAGLTWGTSIIEWKTLQ